MTNLKSPVVISSGILFIIIAGWFYWFQWRPTQIKKQCYEYMARSTSFRSPGMIAIGMNWDKESFYQDCLRKKGL